MLNINKLSVVIFFLFINFFLFSQNHTTKEVEEYVKLGRDSIIKSAIEQLGCNLSLEHYNVNVMVGKDMIHVTFSMPINFIPQNSAYYYSAYIDVINKTSSKTLLKNPKDFNINNKEINFFHHTKESEAHIKFIIEAIEKSDEIESVKNINNNETSMTVFEYNDYYEVIVLSKNQESFYKIKKKSGKIYDAGHAHLIHEEDNKIKQTEFIEIK